MRAIEQIRQSVESEIFDYTQLVHVIREYSKPRDVISSLLKKGDIIRIRKGLYLFSRLWQRKPVIRETAANLIYGPSIISLDYALAFYGLIPERVDTITSVTTGRAQIYDTPIGRFNYVHLSYEHFSFGATIQNPDTGNWLIAEPVKTLADKIWTDKRFKPTSPSSFNDYLFKDLRIDEAVLSGYLDLEKMRETETKYSSRKISWLMEFIIKRFSFKSISKNQFFKK